MLRAGVRVKTAPWTPTLPWQTVWRQKDGIRCHVGRVFDQDALGNGATEYVQYRFPRKKPVLMTQIDGQLVTTPSGDSSMSKNKGDGISTGSVTIKYKPSYGRGRAGDADLQDVSPESGYVFWGENRFKNAGEPVYVVIAREEDSNQNIVWVMSLVGESALEDSDIKLACVTGSACVQIWQSDIVYTPPSAGEASHPFKVTIVSIEGTTITLKVRSGMVNNVYMGDTEIQFTGEWSFLYVYVKCDGSNSAAWPTSISADVSTTPKTNTETNGYLLVATTDGAFINQLVYTSIWGERHKYTTPNLVAYYYYRV